jgi:GNAT superfamily N-acetyltransferase
VKIRTLQTTEWDQLARLIFNSTNNWYQKNLNRKCFGGSDPLICRIFPEVYETLDPGCCLLAEIDGVIAGSCFYHPRKTHFSVGIMNADPAFAGRGVARTLLQEIIKRAGKKPVRLVSSALNLDSYSLYTRAKFRPLAIYQDMIIPAEAALPPVPSNVRAAKLSDLPAILALEDKVSEISREKDWHYFLSDKSSMWRGFVYETDGELTGFLFSINHPGSRMLGPGVMLDQKAAFALIIAHLSTFGTATPIFLVPANETELIQNLYKLGARNCEIHFSQVLGEAQSPRGVTMPTFMPETA